MKMINIIFVLLCLYSMSAATIVELNSTSDYPFDLIGRFDTSDGMLQADWPGTGLRLRFVADKAVVNFEIAYRDCLENCTYFIEASKDCIPQQKFKISATNDKINFGIKVLKGSHHEVSFIKVTEADYSTATGIMKPSYISVTGASLIKSSSITPCKRSRKMLVFGDSVSAAYGVDGEYPCSFSPDTQNVNHGYTKLVADDIDAELQVVAWSGKGVVRNYGDESSTSVNPLPVYYNRTLASLPGSAENYWKPTDYIPDIIIVMLGSNDYSTEPNPSDDDFINGLVSFLNLIREDYPSSEVLAVCSPSANGPQCDNINESAKIASVNYLFLDPSCYDSGFGCDNHPNQDSQRNMANVMIPAVKDLLRMR